MIRRKTGSAPAALTSHVLLCIFIMLIKRVRKLRVNVIPKLLKKDAVERLLKALGKWLILIKRPGVFKKRHCGLVAGGDDLELCDQVSGSGCCPLVPHDGTDEIARVSLTPGAMNRRELLPLHPPIVEDRHHELAVLHHDGPVVNVGFVADHLDRLLRNKLESKEPFSLVALARELGINRAFVVKRFRAAIISLHNVIVEVAPDASFNR